MIFPLPPPLEKRTKPRDLYLGVALRYGGHFWNMNTLLGVAAEVSRPRHLCCTRSYPDVYTRGCRSHAFKKRPVSPLTRGSPEQKRGYSLISYDKVWVALKLACRRSCITGRSRQLIVYLLISDQKDINILFSRLARLAPRLRDKFIRPSYHLNDGCISITPSISI